MMKGVITATDAGYFPGVRLLSDSIRRAYPLTVFDLGMTGEQRQWLSSREVNVIAHDASHLKHIPWWQTWIKPLLIQESPYQKTLWMDADTYAVQDLGPLFDHIDKQLLVVRHPDGGGYTRNRPDLYEMLDCPVPGPLDNINAGVVGFDLKRDKTLLTLWAWVVNQCLTDAAVRDAVAWCDEGCLTWALSRLDMLSLISDRMEWNFFCRHYLPKTLDDFYRNLPPAAVVAHFVGNKPWISWNQPASNVEIHEHWLADARHREWMYDVLSSYPFRSTLEIGCYSGYTAEAFFKAQETNKKMVSHFCDIQLHGPFAERLVRNGERCKFHNMSSVDFLPRDIDFDFVFVDGDHTLPIVAKETELLLKKRPLCVMAHDTTAEINNQTEVDGPPHLKWSFMSEPGYFCLEDCRKRPNERTERGMFLATKSLEVYQAAQASLKRLGGMDAVVTKI